MQEIIKAGLGMSLETYIAIGGFVVMLVGQIMGGMWFLARMKEQLITLVMEKHHEIDTRYNSECGDLHEKINQESRHFGETASSIRQKMHDMEMWGRDNYARKDDLEKSIELVRETVKNLGDRMSASFDKLEARIERIHPTK